MGGQRYGRWGWHRNLITQLNSPFEKAAQLYTKNESENLTNQQHKTLKRYLVQSAQWRHIMFSEAKNFCSNLHFRLLTETDSNEQLNISMQQLATSFDIVLKIFINAPTTVWYKDVELMLSCSVPGRCVTPVAWPWRLALWLHSGNFSENLLHMYNMHCTPFLRNTFYVKVMRIICKILRYMDCGAQNLLFTIVVCCVDYTVIKQELAIFLLQCKILVLLWLFFVFLHILLFSLLKTKTC